MLAALAAAGTGSAQEPPAAAPVTAIDLGGLDTRSAALMLSAQEAGDLAVSALAVPWPDPRAAGQSRVTLVVDVGGASLLEAVPAQAAELITEVYAYALDAGGGLAASLTQAFRLDLARDRPAPAKGVKFFGELALPAGSYSLRVLVLQRSSGRLGLRILSLAVPSWEKSPVLLPPVRRESPAGWILVHGAGAAPAFPLTADGEPWVPSARRDVDPGSAAGYLLLGRGLDQGLQAQLLDADRQPLAPCSACPAGGPLGDLRPATGGPAELEALAAELDTARLEAGEVRLRISVAGESAISAPLIVRSTDPAMPAPAAPPAGQAARRPSGHRAILERYEELREGYRQALERLAAGDRAGALEPLIAIESARLGSGTAEEQKRLARTEVEIARRFSMPSPGRIVTMIWLHEALYRQYHRHKRYLLATHSRQVVSRLAELYLELDGSARSRGLVASAMVSLAGYLQETGAMMSAEKAYHDALTYDPGHPQALLGLAAIRESYSQHEDAADLLQRLHKARPEDTQARLRLGINLRRLDKARRAASHLEAAIAEPGPEWVAAVAAQELASLYAGDQRVDDALRVLEAAIERHPQVQRLRIQLAATLDRAGRRADALAALDRLDPSAGTDVHSPRLIYSRANTATITAVRRALAEEMNRGLAASGGATE